MTRPIRVGESAAAELAEAVRWHEEKRPGLGAEFRDLVSTVFDVIEQHPDAGSPVTGSSSFAVRRHLIPRFPYQVIYYVRRDAIAVVAIAHTSRRPNYWRKRLSPKPI